MKLNGFIIELQKLQNKGYGSCNVYYEGEEEFGSVEGYLIEAGLEDDWPKEIYLKSYKGDMK